jgi:hypothetical protein
MKLMYGITMSWMFFAQESLAAPATNAGPVVFGVQLKISITNTAIPYGVPTTLSCVVTNSSTNTIALDNPLSPPEDTEVRLVSSSGKQYILTPGPGAGSGKSAFILSANETREWKLTIQLDQTVPAGEYKLHAERWIVIPTNETRNAGGSLTCDLPKVRVMEASPVKPNPGS